MYIPTCTNMLLMSCSTAACMCVYTCMCTYIHIYMYVMYVYVCSMLQYASMFSWATSTTATSNTTTISRSSKVIFSIHINILGSSNLTADITFGDTKAYSAATAIKENFIEDTKIHQNVSNRRQKQQQHNKLKMR